VERAAVEALVGPLANRPVWLLIRAAEASVAEMAIVPAQDLLELGSAARMNTPAVPSGNWSWRAPEKCWTDELAARLAALAEVTDRDTRSAGRTCSGVSGIGSGYRYDESSKRLMSIESSRTPRVTTAKVKTVVSGSRWPPNALSPLASVMCG